MIEIKRVRRIVLFRENDLATVPIAVLYIALLVRVTYFLTKLQNNLDSLAFY